MALTQAQSTASDEQVMNCVDRGLDKIGPNVKHLVYWHLQKIGHIRRADIPNNPEKFVSGLNSLYRESAAGVERAILQEINSTFDLNYGQSQLAAAMIEARQKIDNVKVIS
ncbi:MAG: hypothetical protein OK439_00630 [Thaumarchaeota archaeon]|nr:hypothetical protein [Nitrososphaerota archaeon]